MTTTTETDSGSHSSSEYLDTHLNCISQSLSKTSLQDPPRSEEYHQPEKSATLIPPLIVYTRSQLLSLHNSPLVRPPLNMPELKDWFGSDLDQTALKKDAESQSSGARERRFRRDADDGDSRPSFRSAISQPSQMGNFKHQSLRTNDRDKERDRDGDRERDQRDREGQERLRHLSDKYDRDRMTLSGSGARGKERDGGANASSRLSSQASAATSRRTENRDGTKKKSGEVVDDWRRIGEPSRSGREERLDGGRRDREDRERPRSRVRDSSRSRRESSTSRRERDERDKRDDNARERTSRGDRDRDEPRRDRDRELDKDSEHDDPRHWRDDGKRDERIAARRDRETRERARDRDVTWDSTNDRRWTADERDSRTKRSTRDKKSLQGEDVKDREERKDKDRDREKEKEPAWMDTYIPSSPSFGILGGKGVDGELDGIQAWKKGMKEKEQREKGIGSTASSNGGQDQASHDHSISEKTDGADKQLDEIQLFKLLMKREEEKRKMDPSSSSTVPDFVNPSSSIHDGSGSATIHSASPTETSRPLSDSYHLGQDQPPTSRDSLKAGSDLLNSSLDDSGSPRNMSRPRYIIPPENCQNVGKLGSESVATYNPPSASRLLSLSRPSNFSTSAHLNASDSLYVHGTSKVEGTRSAPGFSPFEEATRGPSVEDPPGINAPETFRRLHVERSSGNPEIGHLENATFEINPSYPGPRGSRFAKFFDNKSRDSAPQPKSQTPVSLASSSPHPNQRSEHNPYESLHGTTAESRTLEDIFAMLNNSSQGHRHIVSPQQTQNNLQLLQQAAYQQQTQQLQAVHRLEPLYESRLDDRNFVPDGMVPGLRTVPTPRNREPPSMYSDSMDDIAHHNLQRSSQQRLDSVYPAPQPMFNQRNIGIPIQQAHFRGGTSPISGQQVPLQNAQRLPPGLANLGGRPPHDQSQFLNVQSVPTPGLHGTAGLQQQNYNTFVPNGLSFGAPFRGPLPPHQTQNSLTHHAMGGLNPPNSVNPNQAQFLAMNGVSMNGLRGANNGPGLQQSQNTHLHAPLLSMRQQQSLHPHALPHMMPHLSQQGLTSQANQPAQDLMALLMGGAHRE